MDSDSMYYTDVAVVRFVVAVDWQSVITSRCLNAGHMNNELNFIGDVSG
jgi:hypothetical protein